MGTRELLLGAGIIVVIAYGIHLYRRRSIIQSEPESHKEIQEPDEGTSLLPTKQEEGNSLPPGPTESMPSDTPEYLRPFVPHTRPSASLEDKSSDAAAIAGVASQSSSELSLRERAQLLDTGTVRRESVNRPPPTTSAGTSSEGGGNCILLEIISGPAAGGSLARSAVQPPWPAITIGRSPQNELHLNDQEVSSRHAQIDWDPQVCKWKLLDKGSLNGTLWNSEQIGCPSQPVRKDGQRVVLSSGDVFTFGTSSRVLVRLSGAQRANPHPLPSAIPFSVAVAADAMTARRGGGKPLPMEDIPYFEWPLRGGLKDFGVFCIFDGHGGRAAAENASRIMPEKLSRLLMVRGTKIAVLRDRNAEEVLKQAFRETEAELPNEDEGCTATVLLVWRIPSGELCAQVANVGDSHCVFRVGDRQEVLTEDHRLTGPVERSRLLDSGHELREGDTRLCGMNIARVLGDKFLKAQNVGLSAEPYISPMLSLGDASNALAIIASDGLWDVVTPKRALQIAKEVDESGPKDLDGGQSRRRADTIANTLISRAKLARTTDNTSVIVLDFSTPQRKSFATI